MPAFKGLSYFLLAPPSRHPHHSELYLSCLTHGFSLLWVLAVRFSVRLVLTEPAGRVTIPVLYDYCWIAT